MENLENNTAVNETVSVPAADTQTAQSQPVNTGASPEVVSNTGDGKEDLENKPMPYKVWKQEYEEKKSAKAELEKLKGDYQKVSEYSKLVDKYGEENAKHLATLMDSILQDEKATQLFKEEAHRFIPGLKKSEGMTTQDRLTTGSYEDRIMKIESVLKAQAEENARKTMEITIASYDNEFNKLAEEAGIKVDDTDPLYNMLVENTAAYIKLNNPNAVYKYTPELVKEVFNKEYDRIKKIIGIKTDEALKGKKAVDMPSNTAGAHATPILDPTKEADFNDIRKKFEERITSLAK